MVKIKKVRLFDTKLILILVFLTKYQYYSSNVFVLLTTAKGKVCQREVLQAYII
jgi:hypothetical protein